MAQEHTLLLVAAFAAIMIWEGQALPSSTVPESELVEAVVAETASKKADPRALLNEERDDLKKAIPADVYNSVKQVGAEAEPVCQGDECKSACAGPLCKEGATGHSAVRNTASVELKKMDKLQTNCMRAKAFVYAAKDGSNDALTNSDAEELGDVYNFFLKIGLTDSNEYPDKKTGTPQECVEEYNTFLASWNSANNPLEEAQKNAFVKNMEHGSGIISLYKDGAKKIYTVSGERMGFEAALTAEWKKYEVSRLQMQGAFSKMIQDWSAPAPAPSDAADKELAKEMTDLMFHTACLKRKCYPCGLTQDMAANCASLVNDETKCRAASECDWEGAWQGK